MTSIAEDFLAEGAALHALLLECSAPDWQRNTSFKSWTIDQVVQHLHGLSLIHI